MRLKRKSKNIRMGLKMKYRPSPLFYVVMLLILFWVCVFNAFACENDLTDYKVWVEIMPVDGGWKFINK